MRSGVIFGGCTLDGIDVIATHLIDRQVGLLNALLFFISFFAIGTTPGAWVAVATFSSVVAMW